MTDSPAPRPRTQTDATPAAPVLPRPAASLLVLRETEAGPEVLMGMRGAGHRFMPNRLVFPGGAVDPEDYAAPVASALPDHVRQLLAIGGDAGLADALGIAAARELEEETALTLGSPPALAGIDYLCRAITPPASPVRFDARFLVVNENEVTGTLAGSGELEGLRFYAAAEALALDLAFVTREVIGKLLAWRALPPFERTLQRRVAVLHNRLWEWESLV